MPPSVSNNRWIFVDFLRFVAVVLMIQGHTFDAVLSYEIRAEGWYGVHSFWHGFTAPLFLFGSGLAFGIATFRKWHHHIAWSPALAKRLRRYGLLLIIGYALHLPYFSLSRVVGGLTSKQVTVFLQSDALHVIAVSLIVAQLSVLFVKDRRRVAVLLATLAVGVALTAPLLWELTLEGRLPTALVAFLNNSTGSIFPFFPWSAYLFGGVLTAYLLRPWESDEPDPNRLLFIAALGMGLLLVGRVLDLLPTAYPVEPHWNANPVVLMSKLGAIILFLVSLYQLERLVRRVIALRQASRTPVLTAVTFMGQESLVIYVIHLIILYGSTLGPGLNRVVGRTQDVPGAIAVFVPLFVAMLVLAWGWQMLKKNRAHVLRTAQWALGLSLTAMFLFSTT